MGEAKRRKETLGEGYGQEKGAGSEGATAANPEVGNAGYLGRDWPAGSHLAHGSLYWPQFGMVGIDSELELACWICWQHWHGTGDNRALRR